MAPEYRSVPLSEVLATPDMPLNAAAYVGPARDSLKTQVRRFVQLERERRELEARLKLLTQESGPLAEQIAAAFEDSGTQHEQVDGLTVYLAYTTWARPKDGDMPRLVAALQAAGLADLVTATVNIQTLSALVRERRKEVLDKGLPDDQMFPAPVLDALAITTARQLKTMQSKGGRHSPILQDEDH